MPRTLAEKLLEEITRQGILEGHSEFAPIESKQDFAERNEQRVGESLAAGNSNQGDQENLQAGQAGPNVVQHPDFIKLDGVPTDLNPEQPREEPTNSHDLLLSRDAQRDKEKNKKELKNKQELKDKPKQRPTNQPKMNNTPRYRPPGT